ncbi:hypothetical protein P43SY_011897 [Pythium insidiosum]|uniref:PiggyBac transposable element-derived protein domain-containing protein n=1 Tax=Pythium insidiosum TaxID=114742 RepID=A0AAD5LSW8_PYTIN|nr:hypothetical protein P43SY_011897 [Pythium insidiosum]
MVSFCCDQEEWMPSKLYKDVGGLFLSGRVHIAKSVKGEKRGGPAYEIRWTVTNFQSKMYTHRVSREVVERGIKTYETLSGSTLNKATWKHICEVPSAEAMVDGENLDDYVVLDGSSDLFVTKTPLPSNLQMVEQITKLDFQAGKKMSEPSDLYTHPDGTTETKLIKDKQHLFSTSSSSFLAYLPLAFWKTVVNETNAYAAVDKGKLVTLEEMLRFFGIMFYMTIVDKGEYSNYWGNQAEDEIFGVTATFGLENFMTLKRFQFIRKNLCFRHKVTPEQLKKDPVARIRPLLSMLKYTSTNYPAPRCVAEYNKHMQGVDRLDQLRAKYSLADGHSMQKWHKKLALAFIDIARVNAYVTKCMVDGSDKSIRNQHRQFMIDLASELISVQL